VAAKWKRPPQYWSRVKAEFAIRFEERFKLETE
jgi:transposase-like protein